MDTDQQLITSRKEGLSYPQIAHKLNLTSNVIRNKTHQLIKKGILTKKQYSQPWTDSEVSYLQKNYTSTSISQLAQELQRSRDSIRWKLEDDLHLAKNKCKYVITPEKKELTSELGYLIGVLLGDGFVTYRKSKVTGGVTYLIGLGTIDKEFAEKFANTLWSWSGMRVRIWLRKVPDRTFPNGVTSHCKLQYHVYAVSKSYGEFLKEMRLNIYSYLPLTPEIFKRQIIKGLFDSEGSIAYKKNKYYRITFSNRNPKILHLLHQLLSFYNFHPVILPPTLMQCGSINLCRKAEVHRFLTKIGCTIKRKEVMYYGEKG